MTQFFFRGERSEIPADKGFTLIELAIIVAIIAVAGSMSIPFMIPWFNNLAVRSAARDLYSTMQEARLLAVENNSDTAVIFDTNNSIYYLCTDPGADGSWSSITDNTVKNSVDLTSARYKNRVQFGNGNATSPVVGTFGDFVTYSVPDNVLVINSKGYGSGGYVYLENPDNGTAYAVGTRSSGLVRLLKWNGTSWH